MVTQEGRVRPKGCAQVSLTLLLHNMKQVIRSNSLGRRQKTPACESDVSGCVGNREGACNQKHVLHLQTCSPPPTSNLLTALAPNKLEFDTPPPKMSRDSSWQLKGRRLTCNSTHTGMSLSGNQHVVSRSQHRA